MPSTPFTPPTVPPTAPPPIPAPLGHEGTSPGPGGSYCRRGRLRTGVAQQLGALAESRSRAASSRKNRRDLARGRQARPCLAADRASLRKAIREAAEERRCREAVQRWGQTKRPSILR